MFDSESFRQQFPFFQQQSLVYLDSAATSLKPYVLLEATQQFYQSAGSVHRSQYDANQTQQFEKARTLVAQWIHACDPSEIIWTSGATHAINLVAFGLRRLLKPGDEIIISEAEHHANFVVWYELAHTFQLKLHVLSLHQGLIAPQELQQKLNHKTKIVALNAMSNVTGAIQPVERLCHVVREHSHALILLDYAQAIVHTNIDVQKIDADFIAFSAHKLYGPTGLGVLYGKQASLALLTPYTYGGKMVEQVSLKQIRYASLPYRLEAGTPNIAGVIGFGAVLEWLKTINLLSAHQYCEKLAHEVITRLQTYPHCRLFLPPHPTPIISFNFDHLASFDLNTLLSEQHIALRMGEHCAHPYLHYLKQSNTLRLSLAPYNTPKDIERFFIALDKSLEILTDDV